MISNATDHAHEQKMIIQIRTDTGVFENFTTSFQKTLVYSTRLKANTIYHVLKYQIVIF